MSTEFDSVHNHHERLVFQAVKNAAAQFPHLANNSALVADIACVALNRLQPRYIRHEVDFSFYLTEKERSAIDRDINEAVQFALEFVQARTAMRARG
jgi:Late competence development protein ComFB